MATGPLRYAELPMPVPAAGELLVRVRACGVCRTDLHVAEGDLPVHKPDVVPGHEVVGEVVALGGGAEARARRGRVPAAGAEGTGGRDAGNRDAQGRDAGDRDAGGQDARDRDARGQDAGFDVGDLVGIAWLRHTCGTCRYCMAGRENLCPRSAYTGWDADGGYAEYATVPAAYAYRLPAGYDDETLAPLLCAGIIGYRAWRLARVPRGGRLGIYGFGASAHLTAQVAIASGATVHVFTRARAARELALELGAASAWGASDPSPEPLDSAILFAPVGTLVPVALAALDRGGTLAMAGIHLSDVPVLNYQRHLFYERTVRSVTANTRADGEEFLRFAGEHRLRVTTTRYPLAKADAALGDLAADRVNGAAVLLPNGR